MPRTRSSSLGKRKSLDKSRHSEDFMSGDSTVNYIWQVWIIFGQVQIHGIIKSSQFTLVIETRSNDY